VFLVDVSVYTQGLVRANHEVLWDVVIFQRMEFVEMTVKAKIMVG
jgi:hypothetical protein